MESELANVVKKSKNQQAWRPRQACFGLTVAELGLAFQGIYVVAGVPTTKPQMDLDFCFPNQLIGLADVFRMVHAFQGLTFAESYGGSNCVLSCS